MQHTIVIFSDQIEQAAHLIGQGKLVAFPTETVYGLGASLFNDAAIAEIFRVKGRPSDNPLIVHLSKKEEIDAIASELPPYFNLLAERFWPGPLTLVVKKRTGLSSLATAGLETIAVRVPAHAVARRLIELVGEPLVAPSSNLSGRPSPTTAAHVLEDFAGKIPAVLDGGPSGVGIESTVLDISSGIPMILRPGHISREEISKLLGFEVFEAKSLSHEAPKSPGMKYKHYAPNCPVYLFRSLAELQNHLTAHLDQKRLILSTLGKDVLGVPTEMLTTASFYAHLRLADQLALHEVVIFIENEKMIPEGLLNRVLRSVGEK